MSDFSPGSKVTKGATIAAGDPNTTTHQFTGSVHITGGLCVSGLPTGSVAGAGSYLGLDTDNCFILSTPPGGGSGDPGGSDTYIQYNNGGAFGGISAFIWDDTNLEISNDTQLIFGVEGGSAASFIKRDSASNYLVISGTLGNGIAISGSAVEFDVSDGVLIKDDIGLFFGANQNSFIKYDSASNQLIVSGSGDGTAISGSIFVADDAIPSGSLAGDGSYIGLDTNGQLVLTESAGGGGGSPGGSDTQIQYNDGGGFGGASTFTYNDSGGDITVTDDTKLYFGTNSDAHIVYDESGNDELIISGAFGGIDIQAPDGVSPALTISAAGSALMTVGSEAGDESVASNVLHAFQEGAVFEDEKAAYFGSEAESTILYRSDDDGYLTISGSAAGISLSGSTVYIRSSLLQLESEGDAHLILNADIGNSGEGDNPAIEFRQDGGANKVAIGMCQTGKDPVGGTFTDGLDNAFATTGLIAGIPIQMGVRKTGTANAIAQFTIETVSGNIGINNPAPKVPLDVLWDGVTSLDNDTGGGDLVLFGTASGPLATGALYYLNSDGGWNSASADVTGSGESQLLGIALGATPADDGMLIKGYFDATTYFDGGFIKGGAVYISSGSIPGGYGYMSGAAPTAADAYVRIIGYATDKENIIYFNPGTSWVELS